MKQTSCIVATLALSAALLTARAAERVADYTVALERAKAEGRDIVVFQRGSDWNRLGEYLHENVWAKEEFARALPADLLLLVVDQPETIGNPPVAGRALVDVEPQYGLPSTPVQRLRDRTEGSTNVQPNQIQSVGSSNGAIFTARADGVWIASGPNPHHEILTVDLASLTAGDLLRLDFPLDDTLPGRGPGRASNGNFAITEIDIADAQGQPVRIQSIWATAHEGGWGAWQAVDGERNKGDNLWNAYGHQHRQRSLLLHLDRPSDRLTITLICRATWGQHVPGALSASIFTDDTIRADLDRVSDAERRVSLNSRFTWRGDDLPRIAYLDREGRPVTSDDGPRRTLTPATLADRIQAMREVRLKRDAKWAEAELLQGSAKSIKLLEGLELTDAGASEGHERCYKPIVDMIREADPQDTSGVLRRMKFPSDPRSMPDLINPANTLAGEKKFAEAIALLDTELNDPRNNRLTTDHLQRLWMAKYNIYRQWPEQEEKRIEVLREIIRIDPSTYLGLGATGYLAMFHKDPTPYALAYGWGTNHVQTGPNVWSFHLGTTNLFDHAGRYMLRIMHNGGKDSLDITRVALMAGSTTLSESAELKTLAPGSRIEIPLQLPSSPPSAPLSVRIESQAIQGKTDVSGRFEIDPLL